MAEKMLVTQALDERDLLKKKINQNIEEFQCVDYARNNEERGINSKKSREEFAAEARAAYQQILDRIARYQKIEAAVIASNASTIIKTSYGEYTVAAAIALRNRMREKKSRQAFAIESFKKIGAGLYKEYFFDVSLSENMINQKKKTKNGAKEKNKRLEEQAETMRLSILGKDTKVKDDKPLAIVDAYINENRTELMDPLGVIKRAEELRMKTATLLKEIDTQIKISNATTLIEID